MLPENPQNPRFAGEDFVPACLLFVLILDNQNRLDREKTLNPDSNIRNIWKTALTARAQIIGQLLRGSAAQKERWMRQYRQFRVQTQIDYVGATVLK